MNRAQLEHVIRASASIAEDDEIYVLGSQSILGAIPDAPEEVTVSAEADVAPKNKPELEAIIEGAIGELSPFHDTFGYYVDGVDPSVLPLPQGWEKRVVVIQNENTRFAKGLCLEPHDCAASKLIAGREKDLAFVSALLRHRLIRAEVLRERIRLVHRYQERIPDAEAALQRLVAGR
ncbi:MAG: hypothetical protein HY721_07065 [Planctomycetes bacterium]|nr:hypothetical protein [Planctomycetota bacterium]